MQSATRTSKTDGLCVSRPGTNVALVGTEVFIKEVYTMLIEERSR